MLAVRLSKTFSMRSKNVFLFLFLCGDVIKYSDKYSKLKSNTSVEAFSSHSRQESTHVYVAKCQTLTLRLSMIWIQIHFSHSKVVVITVICYFLSSSKPVLIPGHDSPLCPIHSPTHSLQLYQRWHTSTFRMGNNIISEVHSGVACFHKSAWALIIVSIITLSFFITVFLCWHISCSLWAPASV